MISKDAHYGINSRNSNMQSLPNSCTLDSAEKQIPKWSVAQVEFSDAGI